MIRSPTSVHAFQTDHEQFRSTVRRFIAAEVSPHLDEWKRVKLVDRSVFRKAGVLGLLGLCGPDEFGGSGIDDFRFNAVVGIGITLHADIVAPYLYALVSGQQRCATETTTW